MPILAAPRGRMPALLPELVRRVDPKVRDVVLIGSAVYAADLARDYDLVVTTTATVDKRWLSDQLSIFLNLNSDKAVDVIIRRPGETIGDLARAILAGRVLWGRGETKAEAGRFFEEEGGVLNSFDQAEGAIIDAEDSIGLAEATDRPNVKDWKYRNAFNGLFNAARVAALTYLGRDNTVWSGVARELPWPYSHNFREMTGTLRIHFSYDGNYPRDRKLAAEEFTGWKEKVAQFVNHLRKRTLENAGDV